MVHLFTEALQESTCKPFHNNGLTFNNKVNNYIHYTVLAWYYLGIPIRHIRCSFRTMIILIRYSIPESLDSNTHLLGGLTRQLPSDTLNIPLKSQCLPFHLSDTLILISC